MMIGAPVDRGTWASSQTNARSVTLPLASTRSPGGSHGGIASLRCSRGSSDRTFPLQLASLVIVLLLLLASSQAAAATYYVDPSRSPCATADAGAGTSPAAAWCTPPGTRNTANSGFLRSQWGSITPSNKIACGDAILLKPSSTQTSTQGGAWLISNSAPAWNGQPANGLGYYSLCSSSNPITIRIATTGEWAGSTAGNFIIDATSITAADAGYIGSPGGTHGIIALTYVSGVSIAGLDANNRIEVKNIAAPNDALTCGLIAGQNDSLPAISDLAFGWFYVHDNTVGSGVCFGGVTNSRAAHGITSKTVRAGMNCGLGNDKVCDGVGWVDIEVDHAGNVSVGNNGCQAYTDAFMLNGARRVYILKSQAHDSGCSGMNIGLARHQQTENLRTLIRGFDSWNNGNLQHCSNLTVCTTNTDCPTPTTDGVCYAWFAQAGWQGGGDHWCGNAYDLITTIEGAHFYQNSRNGFQANHSAGQTEFWNVDVFRNGRLANDQAFNWDQVSCRTVIRNSIHVKRSESFVSGGSSGQYNFCKESCANVHAACSGPSDTTTCTGCDHSQSSVDCVATQCLYGCRNVGALCAVDGECTGCGGSGTCSTFSRNLSIDYSLLRPQTANSETLSSYDFRCMTGCANAGASCISDADCTSCATGSQGWCRYAGSASSTYATALSTPVKMFSFASNHNKIGIAYDPLWPAETGANCNGGSFDFAQCDFSLPNGSPAIDAGTFYMLTNGAGSGTTVNVKASSASTSSDPVAYFIAPFAYLGASGDLIQIAGANCGNGVARHGVASQAQIVGMTSSTITLDDTCTWSDGAGIHLPWAGTAPDMGASEFGLGSQSNVTPPILISVQPAP